MELKGEICWQISGKHIKQQTKSSLQIMLRMVSMEFFVHALPFKEITILRVPKTRCVQEDHIFRQRCDPPPALPHFQSQKRGISLDRSILRLRSFSPTVNSSRPTLMLVRVQRTLKIVQKWR